MLKLNNFNFCDKVSLCAMACAIAIFISSFLCPAPCAAGGFNLPNIPNLPGLPNIPNLPNLPNLGDLGLGNFLSDPALIRGFVMKIDVGNAVTKQSRLEKTPPYRNDDFGLMIENDLLEPIAEDLIKTTKFEYKNMKGLLSLAFEVAAKYLGYKIKNEDEAYLSETVKRILAISIDESKLDNGSPVTPDSYTLNVENQIFECFDSFFGPRSDVYLKRSAIERRQMFNVIADDPIYPNNTSGAKITFAGKFPEGHPYSGYSIYKCAKPRFLWYVRYSIKNNVSVFKEGLAKEDAAIGKPKKDDGGAISDMKTMGEMFKVLRTQGKGQKILKESVFEQADISGNEGFANLKKTNTGDMLNEMKMSGYTINRESSAIYNKLWENFSNSEK